MFSPLPTLFFTLLIILQDRQIFIKRKCKDEKTLMEQRKGRETKMLFAFLQAWLGKHLGWGEKKNKEGKKNKWHRWEDNY